MESEEIGAEGITEDIVIENLLGGDTGALQMNRRTMIKQAVTDFGKGIATRIRRATYEDSALTVFAIGIGKFTMEVLWNWGTHPSRADWALKYLVIFCGLYVAVAIERSVRLYSTRKFDLILSTLRLHNQDLAADLIHKIKRNGADPDSPPSFFLPTELGALDPADLHKWWEDETAIANGKCPTCKNPASTAP